MILTWRNLGRLLWGVALFFAVAIAIDECEPTISHDHPLTSHPEVWR